MEESPGRGTGKRSEKLKWDSPLRRMRSLCASESEREGEEGRESKHSSASSLWLQARKHKCSAKEEEEEEEESGERFCLKKERRESERETKR
ncbi:hypothetical protein CRG98_049919 [Punica granatum]|uniref:Uncharacterized protein n=1 Tax=Punica granatum TaxID=22663 RepID=A0A2I0H1J7_PUNGR|nr:hypothetical protein CRG98_049919 [Punica granatum]